MAKIYGLFGSMTGKLADTVMSVRNGEQIARKYQPIVSNPSTPAQVAQRAKLKLLSQLSAVMAPVIAIPRRGSVSSRNLFTKINYPLAGYATDTASITLTGVQLTASVVALPSILAERGEESIEVSMETPYATTTGEPYGIDVDKVVYCMFVKGADEKLRYVTSAVVSEAGVHNDWAGTLPSANAEVVVLAYGIRYNNENARSVYGSLEAPTAVTIAKLIVTSSLTGADVTLTETRGIQLPAVSNRDGGDEVEKKATKKK